MNLQNKAQPNYCAPDKILKPQAIGNLTDKSQPKGLSFKPYLNN